MSLSESPARREVHYHHRISFGMECKNRVVKNQLLSQMKMKLCPF